jgi:hypothetical protein
MPNELRNADGASRVAGRGLNPDLVVGTLAQEATIADAIERETTR